MKKKKIIKFFTLLILLIVYICISAYSYASTISNNIANSVFRLHVIANSDSDEDQNLKYKVRDNVIAYMNTLISDNMSKDDVIEIANEHSNDFYNIAKETIKENGYNYDVDVTIGESYFPTKTYGDVSLPAGVYDALKIKIGKAEGHNWWCVMFPPLCFVDVTSGIVPEESKSLLKDNLDNEEYSLVTSDDSKDSDVKVKFKIVELVENIESNLSKK